MEHDELESLRSEAISCCNRGDFDRALINHRNILAKYKDSDQTCAYSYASIGDIYLTLGRLGLAEGYVKRALGYDPLNPNYHYLLGFTYSVAKQWDKAVKEFQVSVKQQARGSRMPGGKPAILKPFVNLNTA